MDKFNPVTNSSSTSLIVLNRELSQNEFISLKNFADGSYFIISKFSKDEYENDYEYECSGTCFCSTSEDDYDSRMRRSAAALTRLSSSSLFFIISAISTFSAIRFASEFFLSECKQKYFGECIEENIEPIVDVCSKIKFRKSLDKTKIDNKVIRAPFSVRRKRNASPRRKRYFCRGHCVVSSLIRNPAVIREAHRFRCRDRVSGAAVEIVEGQSWHFPYGKNGAKKLFLTNHLKDFCRTVSFYQGIAEDGRAFFTSLCVAGHSDWTKYPNIQCHVRNNWEFDGSIGEAEKREVDDFFNSLESGNESVEEDEVDDLDDFYNSKHLYDDESDSEVEYDEELDDFFNSKDYDDGIDRDEENEENDVDDDFYNTVQYNKDY